MARRLRVFASSGTDFGTPCAEKMTGALDAGGAVGQAAVGAHEAEREADEHQLQQGEHLVGLLRGGGELVVETGARGLAGAGGLAVKALGEGAGVDGADAGAVGEGLGALQGERRRLGGADGGAGGTAAIGLKPTGNSRSAGLR